MGNVESIRPLDNYRQKQTRKGDSIGVTIFDKDH